MSSIRKRDDPHEGALYRVAARYEDEPDSEWEHTSYGHYGAPRTYMTLSAAKGMATRMRRHNEEAVGYRPTNRRILFRVECAPVANWEPVE